MGMPIYGGFPVFFAWLEVFYIVISLLSKSKTTSQAKSQLLKVAKRNKASLSDETLDSLIATNIQVVRRDNHDHNFDSRLYDDVE